MSERTENAKRTRKTSVPAPSLGSAANKKAGNRIARAQKILDQMRANPHGDWKIEDIKSVCDQIGMTLTKPTRGSHYKVFSQHYGSPMTLPFKRPIKPCYIKIFLSIADRHVEKIGTENAQNGAEGD